MKFFFGFNNIASLYDDLSAGLKELGHEVVTFTTSAKPIVSRADYDISMLLGDMYTEFKKKHPQASQRYQAYYLNKQNTKLMDFAFQKASEADVCVFFWHTFRTDCKDLDTLKKMGKKIVVVLCGSECRVVSVENYYRAIAGSPKITNVQQTLEDTKMRLQYLRLVEQKTDLVVGGTHAGLRPSYLNFTLIFDSKNIPFHVSDRDIPNILHAPSSRASKGTDIWMQIFKELKEEGYEFNLHLAEGVPHHELMQNLANMDIVCDSLFIGGKLSREAMATGCACLAPIPLKLDEKKQYFIDDMEYFLQANNIPKDSEKYAYALERVELFNSYDNPDICPIVPVDVYTAKDRLRELLQNKAMRMDLAQRGIAYIEKYCSPVKIAQDMLDCLAAPDDFYSQAKLWNHKPLLRHGYKPESPEELAIINETLDIVRDCEWYKRGIKPGHINGINF